MRRRLSKILDGYAGFPSSAWVEGLLVALFVARREVPESEWAPLVLGTRELDEETSQVLLSLVVHAWYELKDVMSDDPSRSVPPARSNARRQWCAGFVKGMKLADEPPRDNLPALSIVISMDVYGGGFPFEELEFEVPKSEKQWRQDMEETLPDLVLALTADISEKALEESEQTLKAIARNDPCPCGSGKKFKKCCDR